MPRIRDLAGVRAHPTVVRLDHLDGDGVEWISDHYYRTQDIERSLASLQRSFEKDHGTGIFVVGQYGSGKSHFLAYLVQNLRSGRALSGELRSAKTQPVPFAVSLLNYPAETKLEDIICRTLHIDAPESTDRRIAWSTLSERHGSGVLLVVDELSEFLRSKPTPQSFAEDVRFLQFMGEWASGHRFWIVAAMQEQIEHTGQLDDSIYRKIKDRYPLLFNLSPTHVRSLIAEAILVKKPGYAAAVDALAGELRTALGPSVDIGDFVAVYPVHPATLDLLEEVRGRFSQARGVIDFVVTQLQGDPVRRISPLLDEAWGALLTPDRIIDHFRDILDVQPEFLPVAQKLFPYYRERLAPLFPKPAQERLAERVLKLLVLAYLSPNRTGVTAADLSRWLVPRVSSIDPSVSTSVIERILAHLCAEGRYVVKKGDRYALELEDDRSQELDARVQREIAELEGKGDLAFEMLVPLLEKESWSPFALPRDEWQARNYRWHFHDRRFDVFFGNRAPPAHSGAALCIRLPWGTSEGGDGLATLIPAKIERTRALVELAALLRLRDRPLSRGAGEKLEERIRDRAGLWIAEVRAAYANATLLNRHGGREPAIRPEGSTALASWLDQHAKWILRTIYPEFENYAPSLGPLGVETYRKLMRAAKTNDLSDPDAEETIRLVREGYLVPLKLMERRGREYSVARLDRHELVHALIQMAAHEPNPKAVYDHFAQPIWGLVPDQVSLLLIFLTLKGELDIRKGRETYREGFEALPNPISYDRVVLGHALSVDQLAALEKLSESFSVRTPKQWTVFAQRHAIEALREKGRVRSERLDFLRSKLAARQDVRALRERLERMIESWSHLLEGENPIAAFERFLARIGTPQRFLQESAALEVLPEQIEKVVEQIERLRHVLGHAEAIERVGAPPPLDDLTEVEAWIEHAKRAYEKYKREYEERHRAYWASRAADPALSFEPAEVTDIRSVGLSESVRALRDERTRARAKVCRGLVNLDYQPRCSCAFDGESSAIDGDLGRLREQRARIERELDAFFARTDIKAAVRAWHASGIERTEGTTAYLEGRANIPEIHDLGRFDEHLAGVEVVKALDLSAIAESLSGRTWDRAELISAIERLLADFGGARIRVVAAGRENREEDLAAWCLEQSLRFGAPLPKALPKESLRAAERNIAPAWIGAAALANLEHLGLSEQALIAIAAMIVDRRISLPLEGRYSALAGAAKDVVAPRTVRSPEELADRAAELYRAHPILSRAAARAWLERLEVLAATEIDPEPVELARVLEARRDHSWIMIDALGLPLLGMLRARLPGLFPQWRLARVTFASVSTLAAGAATTTSNHHRRMLEAGFARACEKIDGVDALLHGRYLSFADLEHLAAAEVEIGIRRIANRLDANKPIVVFADHGFRISADGRSYVHGGLSALERVVPVIDLTPADG